MHGPLTYDLVSLLRDCYVDNDPDWIDPTGSYISPDIKDK